jgi:hypothetical protein
MFYESFARFEPNCSGADCSLFHLPQASILASTYRASTSRDSHPTRSARLPLPEREASRFSNPLFVQKPAFERAKFLVIAGIYPDRWPKSGLRGLRRPSAKTAKLLI